MPVGVLGARPVAEQMQPHLPKPQVASLFCAQFTFDKIATPWRLVRLVEACSSSRPVSPCGLGLP